MTGAGGGQSRWPRGARRTVQMGRRLWRQAASDLGVARMTLQPGGYYASVNFSYQAAEKSLKAARWHLRAEEPSWTHNLRELAEQLVAQVDEIPVTVRTAIDILLPMFEHSRYPSGRVEEPVPADLIGEGEARQAIQAAEEVMSWMHTLLLRPPGKPRQT